MYRNILYSRYLSSINTTWEELEIQFETPLILHKEIDLPSDKNAKVGCGSGAFLNTLRKNNYLNLQGVEKGEEQIKFLQSKGLKIYNQDIIEFLKIDQDKYDLITLFDVLEHFNKNELVELVRLLKDRLAENGMVVMRVPNAEAVLKGSIMYGDFTHETFFTNRSLLQLFTTFGFSKVYVFPVYSLTKTFRGKLKLGILKFYFWLYKLMLSIDNSASAKYFIPTQNILAIIKK